MEPTQADAVITEGGMVGRIKLAEFSDLFIGIQFSYLNDENNKVDTDIYLLEPEEAVYCGWHLLRRGVMDSIKSLFKNIHK